MKDTTIAQFRDKGYIILESCIPPALLEQFERELAQLANSKTFDGFAEPGAGSEERFLAAFKSGGHFRSVLYSMIQTLPSLREIGNALMALPAIAGLLKERDFTLPGYSQSMRVDIPNEEKFMLPPHQDYAGMRSNKAIRVWLPLREVGPGLGSVRVYDGSHTEGVIDHDGGSAANPAIPADKLEKYPAHQITAPGGTGVAFDMMLVHESTANHSDRIKFILTFTIQDLATLANPDDPADKVGQYFNLHRARTAARAS